MLRSSLFILLVCLFSSNVTAQQFQNGDFETLIDCPGGFDFDLAITTTLDHWISVQGTSDGWHEECPAIAGSTNGVVPLPAAGNAYGGFFMNEAMAQELTSPLSAGTTYCVAFDGFLSPIVGELPEDLSCFKLCLYGTNTTPVASGGFDLPIPVDEMPDTELLACSDIVGTSAWNEYEFTFEAQTSYTYLIVTGFQEGNCMEAPAYICFDNIAFVSCETNSVTSIEQNNVSIYPNPTTTAGWNVQFTSAMKEGSISLYGSDGKLLYSHQLKGEQLITIPSHSLEAGMYFLSCETPNTAWTEVLFVH